MVLFKQWVRMNFDGGFLNLCPQNSYCDTKGQLISKGNFGALKSTKKPTRMFALASKMVQIKKKLTLS